MAKMIKVTGLLYAEDLGHDDLDLSHAMGVSDSFYSENANGMQITTAAGQVLELTDIEFELVEQA